MTKKTNLLGRVLHTFEDRRISLGIWIAEKPDAGNVRHNRRQQLQLLWRRVIGRARQSSDVATGTHQARDEAIADGIGRVGHDDWNRAGCPL
jgi:hypothetical protein